MTVDNEKIILKEKLKQIGIDATDEQLSSISIIDGKISPSSIQRTFQIGYSAAKDLIDKLNNIQTEVDIPTGSETPKIKVKPGAFQDEQASESVIQQDKEKKAFEQELNNKLKSFIGVKTTPEEKFKFLESLPEGTIIQSDPDQRLIIPQKRISKHGSETFELIPQYRDDETGEWKDLQRD